MTSFYVERILDKLKILYPPVRGLCHMVLLQITLLMILFLVLYDEADTMRQLLVLHVVTFGSQSSKLM